MTILKIFFYGPWDILKLSGMHFGFYYARNPEKNFYL